MLLLLLLSDPISDAMVPDSPLSIMFLHRKQSRAGQCGGVSYRFIKVDPAAFL